VFLWDFLPCKAVYDIIYRYKYTTYFMNFGIKLLNIKIKETKNGHTGYFTEHIGFFFSKVFYSSHDAPLFLF